MEFVTGYGTQSKSGGRVVKNVTGYDLHKPLIGSLGTLAVITRINFKTFPLPEREAGFVVKVQDFAAAHTFCRAIFESPLEPATLVVISGDVLADIVSRRNPAAPAATGDWSVFATAAGNEAVVARHRRDFLALAARIPGAQISEVSSELCGEIAQRVREFPRYAKDSGTSATVTRIASLRSILPAAIGQLTQIIRQSEIPTSILVHAFGLVYLSLQPESGQSLDAVASALNSIFASMRDLDANARIESAPVALKQRVGVWGPRREDFELMARVKRVFDPGNILSPGRFLEGV
jgi:glycolate oxidase FAD binding subunit